MRKWWVLVISLTAGIVSGTSTMAQTCTADRTPLEMGGHTLCLPMSAPPSVFTDETGKINLLSWSNISSLPSAAPVPPGTFHLSVDLGQFTPPSIHNTQPSDLPNMREIVEVSSTFLFPQGVQFKGGDFRLQCRVSINPQTASRGGQDCYIDAMAAAGLRIRVDFGTVVWAAGPAWPPLDEDWISTWPPYLANLQSGISNLLSIQ